MLLETTVAGVNSGLQRARAAVDSLVPAASAVAAATSQRELLAEYVDAWEREDIDGIVALLREDAVLRMPPQPSLIGARSIGDFFERGPCGGTAVTLVRPAFANGRPAVVMHQLQPDGYAEPHGLLVFELTDSGDAIAGFDAYIDASYVEPFEAERV